MLRAIIDHSRQDDLVATSRSIRPTRWSHPSMDVAEPSGHAADHQNAVGQRPSVRYPTQLMQICQRKSLVMRVGHTTLRLPRVDDRSAISLSNWTGPSIRAGGARIHDLVLTSKSLGCRPLQCSDGQIVSRFRSALFPSLARPGVRTRRRMLLGSGCVADRQRRRSTGAAVAPARQAKVRGNRSS